MINQEVLRNENVRNIITEFPHYVNAFRKHVPFTKYGQLEYHLRTIKLRRNLGSVENAIVNDEFMKSLYETLQAWGIGQRGSKLLSIDRIKQSLQNNVNLISALQVKAIDNENINVKYISETLRYLMEKIEIVDNKAKLVSFSKTLHHLLPELMIPIDREYTRKYLSFYGAEFQSNQNEFLDLSIELTSKIARNVKLDQYLDTSWNSSKSKIIDNAIIGYIIEHPRTDLL